MNPKERMFLHEMCEIKLYSGDVLNITLPYHLDDQFVFFWVYEPKYFTKVVGVCEYHLEISVFLISSLRCSAL